MSLIKSNCESFVFRFDNFTKHEVKSNVYEEKGIFQRSETELTVGQLKIHSLFSSVTLFNKNTKRGNKKKSCLYPSN